MVDAEVEERPPVYVPSVLDALVWPDDTAAALAAMVPGGQVGVCLDALDVAALSSAGRIDALVAVRRQQAWLAAREQQLLAVMVADVESRESLHDPSGHCWLAEEVACALRMAPSTVEAKLFTAVELATRLPATLTLLAAGEISIMPAVRLAEATAALDDSQTSAPEMF